MAKSGKNRVIIRYKLSILVVFALMTVVSMSLASFQYYKKLAAFEQQSLSELSLQTEQLNNHLEKAVRSVEAMQKFANYSMNLSSKPVLQSSSFSQDNERFYLNVSKQDLLQSRHHLSANITGIGDIQLFDDVLLNELSMAQALTPAFMLAQNTNDLANWFYYISKQQFVSMYPWVHRDTWQYSKQLFQNEHIEKISKFSRFSSQYHWSDAYIGNSNHHLYTSVGAGVFSQNEFIGAVLITLDLAKLHKTITPPTHYASRYLLVNKQEQVLLDLTRSNNFLDKQQLIKDILPEELKDISHKGLMVRNKSFHHNSWLIQQQSIGVNDWIFFKIQPKSSFAQPIFNQTLKIFLLLLLGMTIILFAIYFVTRKTFIRPTQEFINHISHSAKGDNEKVKPPKGWEHWFDVVGYIFSQNRSLLQQLKDQNNILDLKVNEKTLALVEKNEQHQRDYAILRSVMDAIPDYLIFNDSNGLVVGCNLAFEIFIKQKEHNIFDQKATALLPISLSKALVKATNELDENEGDISSSQIVETVDNTFELFTSKFYDASDKELGSIIIIRDITEQSANNIALSDAKEQAELANNAKNQFLANMSHEIRTPINAIQGMYALLEKSVLSQQQKIHLTNAQTASDALLYLVDELLDLAKIESGNFSIIKSDCSLDDIVHQAINLNINQAKKKNLTLEVAIDFNVPLQVKSDAMRLVQVLSNLINNAIKFTHQGGVYIHLEVITDSQIDTLVKFTVKDSGIGIEKANQADLFKAFIQADESMTRLYGGSGLGLSICQRIVNLLEGEIKLKSASGEGSEFSFVLPMRVVELAESIRGANEISILNIQGALTQEFRHLMTQFNFEVEEASFDEFIDQQLNFKNNVLAIDLDAVDDKFCLKLQAENRENIPLLMARIPLNDTDYTKQLTLLDSYELTYTVNQSPLYRYDLISAIKKLNSRNLIDDEHHVPLPETTENKEPPSDKRTSLSGLHVLLVEDNLVNQLVAKEILIGLKATVEVVDNGEKAVEFIKNESFDVVLMDIQMPVMDGLTATKLIREDKRFSDLPIIAMTAHTRQDDKDNCIAAGMNLHISKPVKIDVLLSEIIKLVS